MYLDWNGFRGYSWGEEGSPGSRTALPLPKTTTPVKEGLPVARSRVNREDSTLFSHHQKKKKKIYIWPCHLNFLPHPQGEISSCNMPFFWSVLEKWSSAPPCLYLYTSSAGQRNPLLLSQEDMEKNTRRRELCVTLCLRVFLWERICHIFHYRQQAW